MENIFRPVLFNPVNNEPSIFNENWLRFQLISDVHFIVNSPLVPCILSSINGKPRCVIKLFCDHPNLTWDHVNKIPSRPLTNVTKGPQYAVTHNFAKSIQADMLFHWSSNYQLYGINKDKTVVHFRSYVSRRRRFSSFIKQRNQNSVCFYFIHRLLLLQTLLSLPWKLYRINAAWCPWTWNSFFTVYFSTSRQCDL